MLSLLFDVTKLHGFGMLILAGFGFAVVCAHAAPQLIVRTNPQAVIEFLLPSFRVLTGLLLPLTFALVGLTRRDRDAATGVRNADGQPAEAARAGQRQRQRRPQRAGRHATPRRKRTATNAACSSRSSTSAKSSPAK